MSATEGHGHDHHGSHAVAPPAEPKTPMWLPALGALLFLLAGLWWGIGSSGAPAPETEATPAASASASAPTQGAQPGSPQGLTPDQAAQLQKLIHPTQ